MYVVLDETGSFRDSTKKRFGIVTLVTITDAEWSSFQKFMDRLFPQGLMGVKGKTINDEVRKKVLNYINAHQEIKYTSFIYDLTSEDETWVERHCTETIKKAEEKIVEMGDQLQPSYVDDLRLYFDQLRNYSVGDYAKFVMFTEIFLEWQRFFQFDYVYTHVSRDEWRMHHIIDTQNQPNKFIRLVQATMILTTSELNHKYSIYTPEEWDAEHPYLVYHSENGDVHHHNAKKFFEDFIIGSEQEHLQLFLPDFIGYTIMSSITKRNEKKWLKNLYKLWPNRSLALSHGGKKDYYRVTGFDKSRDRSSVNFAIKEHFQLMKSI